MYTELLSCRPWVADSRSGLMLRVRHSEFHDVRGTGGELCEAQAFVADVFAGFKVVESISGNVDGGPEGVVEEMLCVCARLKAKRRDAVKG